jgi:guanylate kinase
VISWFSKFAFSTFNLYRYTTGAAAMKAAGLDAVYVFFAHPEEDAMQHRANLVDAGEPEGDLEQRMEEAAAELEAARGTVDVVVTGASGDAETVPEPAFDHGGGAVQVESS